MKKLYCVDAEHWLEPTDEFDYPEDVKQIVEALARHGYEVDPRHAEAAWSKMSTDEYCAGWLMLDHSDDAAIVSMLLPHLEEG